MPFLSFAIDGRRAFVCLIEAALIAAMFWGSHRVLGYSMWSETSFDGVFHQAIIPTALIFAAIVACGGYQPDVQSQSSEMAQRVALGAVSGGLLVLIISLVFFQHDRPAAPLVVGIALSIASLIALRLTFTRIRFDVFENRVAVLGAGERAARLTSALPGGARDRIVGYIANSADRTMAAPAAVAAATAAAAATRTRRAKPASRAFAASISRPSRPKPRAPASPTPSSSARTCRPPTAARRTLTRFSAIGMFHLFVELGHHHRFDDR